MVESSDEDVQDGEDINNGGDDAAYSLSLYLVFCRAYATFVQGIANLYDLESCQNGRVLRLGFC